MGFERNEYLRWYIPRMFGAPAINLHASGVPALAPGDIRVPEVDPWHAAGLFEEALAGWLSIPAHEVLFTPGATGGTLLALMTLTSPGDDILVEQPVYEPMLRQAQRLGTVRRFGRIPSSGWRFPLDEVVGQMTGRTSLVMITEPSNPSGTFLPREEVLALADLCASRSVLLLVNEVYRGYTDAPSFHGEAESIVVVSSLSKLLGAYWARLGWISARPEIVEKLRAAHRNMSMPTAPGAAVGLGVMERADEIRAEAMSLSSAGVDTVDTWVKSRPGLSWTRPQGPGFGCVMLPEDIDDDVRFAEKLHDEHGVLVVPGTHFEVPGSLRISWLQAGGDLEEGLGRIGKAL